MQAYIECNKDAMMTSVRRFDSDIIIDNNIVNNIKSKTQIFFYVEVKYTYGRAAAMILDYW